MKRRLLFAAAAVAAALTPALMPGMPVILAAVVALVVGWFNWLGAAPSRAGARQDPWDEPEDTPERKGMP